MTTLTYNDTLSAYSSYPAPIRPYLNRLETHPALRTSLTKSFMRVLVDVVSRAPIAEPKRSIRLRVDIVAEKLGISTKTVTRAITYMKGQGWLNPGPTHDGRNYRGQFTYHEYIVGTDLRELLGLPVEENESAIFTEHGYPQPSSSSAKNDTDFVDETRMSHGVNISNKFFLKEASLNEEPSLKTQTSKAKQFNIPTDLQHLNTEFGIDLGGVCGLMRLAKLAKQRLQDVVKLKKDYLLSGNIREGRAYLYLEKLLNSGEDFSFRARQTGLSKRAPWHKQEGTQGFTPIATKTSENADNSIVKYYDKKFTGPNGIIVKVHGDGSGEAQEGHKFHYITPGDMRKVFALIDSGKLWIIQE